MTARKDPIPTHVRAAISAAQEKQAADVILLDLEGLGAFTDYFVVCTGFSSRQLEAICEEIEERLERSGTRLQHREGKSGKADGDQAEAFRIIFKYEARSKIHAHDADHYDSDRLYELPRNVRSL